MTPAQRLWQAVQHWRAGELFAAVQGNARVIVITEGVCAVPHQWLNAYLPLYMVALGVGRVEVGLLASLLTATQLLSTLLGGYLADRFGRKRVLVVGDIICWGVPLFLYTVARDPWYFWLGTIINGFVYVVLPGFQCLFVEDVPPERRSAVFGMLQLLTSLASLFAPVAGLMVSRLGMVPAGRIMAGTTMAFIVGTAIVRQFTLRETTVGQARIRATSGLRWRGVLHQYLEALRFVWRSYVTRSFLSVRILNTFTATMWATYSALYLTDAAGLRLAKSTVALLPFVSAIVTIIMLVLAARVVAAGEELRNLIAGHVLWLAAALCFVASVAGTLWLVMVWAVIQAVGNALLRPALQSYWANIVGEWERAQIFAFGSSLTWLCSLPAGLVAGAMYALSPRAPFLLAMALQACALALLISIVRLAAQERSDRSRTVPL